MLALTRRAGQSILIGEDIEIHVVRMEGERVVLGVRAPREIRILRAEILAEVGDEVRGAASSHDGVLALVRVRA